MVEYKKLLINLKGGGTRNYYYKLYKNGNKIRVNKNEYYKKGGEIQDGRIYSRVFECNESSIYGHNAIEPLEKTLLGIKYNSCPKGYKIKDHNGKKCCIVK